MREARMIEIRRPGPFIEGRGRLARYAVDWTLPARVLDFTRDILSTPLVLTRGSAGTYFDGQVIQTAPANVPRYETVSTRRALLLENSSTNLVTKSVATSVSWTNTNAVPSDLSLNALGIFPGLRVASAGATWHRASVSQANYAANTDYTVTFWYMAGSVSTVLLTLYNATYAVSLQAGGTVGAIAATVQSGASISRVVNNDLGGGVYSVSVTFQVATASYISWGIGPGSAAVGDSIIALGAQLEQDSTATSYIATNGTAATRAADFASADLSAGTYDVRTVLESGAVDALGVGHSGGAYWPEAATGHVLMVLAYPAGVL